MRSRETRFEAATGFVADTFIVSCIVFGCFWITVRAFAALFDLFEAVDAFIGMIGG